MSLKVGLDCRDSGLGWILKKLKQLKVAGKGSISSGEKENEKQSNLIVNINNTHNNNNNTNNNNLLTIQPKQ